MVTVNNVKKIPRRVDTLPLYLHAYTFHLNMRPERMLPADLFDIASEDNLRGVKIHVLDGERFSLGSISDRELSVFGDKARRLDLDIRIEASASDKKSISETVAITLEIGASPVRFYPRYEGSLRDVLSIIVNDIAYVRETYQDSGLTFMIEQHEDLKSRELVSLVKKNEVESLSLLFNFVNMTDVNKHPIDTLETVAPHIIQIHVKGVLTVKEQGGLRHKAYVSGQGDMPFRVLLTHFICLGDDEPQVAVYGLEEEADYYAPAFRFEDEDDNPQIPYRQMSEAPLPENHLLDTRLRKEKEDVTNQIDHVCNVLQQIKQEASHLLNN